MIRIPYNLLAKIREHSQCSYPEECCGFLLGRTLDDLKLVSEVRAASNARQDERHRRFFITSEEYQRVAIAARAKQLDIVGFYHSHPDIEACPSQFDTEHAWPWFSYIIVSVHRGKFKIVRSWVIDDERENFIEEEVYVDGSATKSAANRTSTLSNANKH